MSTQTTTFAARVLATTLLLLGSSGCELIASVDRSEIPTGEDASVETDYGIDSSTGSDSSTAETGGDSATGADGAATDGSGGKDGATDGATDGGRDGGGDGGGTTCEGGAMACTSPSPCTGSTTLGGVDTCSSGCCGTSDASSGTT